MVIYCNSINRGHFLVDFCPYQACVSSHSHIRVWKRYLLTTLVKYIVQMFVILYVYRVGPCTQRFIDANLNRPSTSRKIDASLVQIT